MVDDPADERTATDTPQKLCEDPAAGTIIRVGFRAPDRLVTLIFALASSFQPPFERVDPRIFADRVSCGLLVAHAMFLTDKVYGTLNGSPPRAPPP